jgi:membrane dipeptidase
VDANVERSQALHASAIVIDALNVSRWSAEVFEHLNAGGLTAINATVAVLENFRETIVNIAGWQRMFEQYGALIMPVRNAGDIQRAKQAGKVGIILGFQNTSPIEEDLHLLSVFQQLGVRIIQICYMERNLVGDGCLERTDCGLSRFGLEVIEEMNRLGVLIDLSHVGYTTTMEAIEASTQPVAFTHANPATLCRHPRNKTDEQLRALAKKGGVVGANIFPPFLAAGARATVDDFVAVIDYLVQLIGIDHVGIGTDFTAGQPAEFFDWIVTGRSKQGPAMQVDFPIVNPAGIRSPADFPNITRALLARGYAEPDVRKIMGENFLRLFQAVWR